MILKDGEVKLRQLKTDDVSSIAELLNNKNIWDNLRDYIPFPYSEKDARAFIADCKQKKLPTLAITFQDKICGVIGLIQQKDVYRHSAEVGYWIGEPFWNKGIATKALRLMTAYAFDIIKLDRIFAASFGYNIGSQKVLEKCGFKQEGVARNAVIKNDEYADEHRYALLKNDWSKIQ